MTTSCWEKYPSITVTVVLLYFWLLISYLLRRFEFESANTISLIIVIIIAVLVLFFFIYLQVIKMFPKLKYSGFSLPGRRKVSIRYLHHGNSK